MKKFLFSGIIACLIGFCCSCTTTEDSAGVQMRAGLPNFNYPDTTELSMHVPFPAPCSFVTGNGSVSLYI